MRAVQSASVLRFEGLVVGHGTRVLVGPLDCDFEPGHVHAIVGPNGSGKSTLVRTAIGLQRPLAGRVQLGHEARVSYVPQVVNLDASMPVTALEVVEMGRPVGERRAERRARARAALDGVGLLAEGRRAFALLSGGQQQRVLIARAFCADANLVVLDEATSGVDAEASEAVYAALRDLTREGRTVLLVTHEQHALARVADRTWVIEGAGLHLQRAGSC